MPNIKTKNLTMPNFPATFGESHFCFVASSDHEKLVKVIHKTYEFFIQIREKNGTYLIKADKITRPSQVVFVHQAMRDFRDLCGCEVLFSNIDSHKYKTLKSYAALKSISYFVDAFQYDKELWVEVGFGSGRHLLHQAKAHPDIQFVGLEIHKPSIEQVAKQCELQEINNIALLDFDARIFFEFLASNSVGRIFVHFPVPWDEKPHRRVISQDFIQESLRILKPEGTLELRTDSDKYFHYSLGEFLRLNKATLSIKKNQELAISSKYEDRWKRQEKDIYDLTLTHHDSDEAKEKIGKLAFEKGYDFATINKNFVPTLRKDDSYFLHIEKMYQIDTHEGIIKVSFGSSFKNERAFIYLSSDKTQYFPDNVLATKANQKAHDSMKEWLNEIQK
ncbi:tRNA (guanosine(46)-N7)-methyltransferase TrmB [Sulfurospirillum sp. 1612]|uniref:tRNA (guanosine(46)-N7)-methyltransferase TrmB n=1 Tax=Sulfurospirillum sp. 1612 TaxID=3094835 RepID=UPI002F95FAF1